MKKVAAPLRRMQCAAQVVGALKFEPEKQQQQQQQKKKKNKLILKIQQKQ